MKFFTLKKIHNPKVHPLSKTVVHETIEVLSRYGITDAQKQGERALELFKCTISNLKFAMAKNPSDEMLNKQADALKIILAKYGIASVDMQEEIILEYMTTLGKI